MKRIAHLFIAALGTLAAADATAACTATATVADVRAAYARGEQQEKAGDVLGALGAYVAAQDYTCEINPVDAEAARRAARLAKPLADAAKARGDHAAAFELYEMGGHFAAADAALVAWAGSEPDDPALYVKALRHFNDRNSRAFAANEELRLLVTGPYRPEPRHMAAVKSMPVRGVERALAAEAEAFASVHPREAMQASLGALEMVRAWEHAVDPKLAATFARLRVERANARAVTREPALVQVGM